MVEKYFGFFQQLKENYTVHSKTVLGWNRSNPLTMPLIELSVLKPCAAVSIPNHALCAVRQLTHETSPHALATS